MTMSHRSAITSSQFVVAFWKPNVFLIFSRSSGVRRLTIVNSTSSRHRSRFGRWELTVHDPAPITPRRSLAIAEGSYPAQTAGVKRWSDRPGLGGIRIAGAGTPPPTGAGGAESKGGG